MHNKIQELSQSDLKEVLKLVEKENIWSSISWQIALTNRQVFGIYLDDFNETNKETNTATEKNLETELEKKLEKEAETEYKAIYGKKLVACIVFSELDKVGEVEQIFVLESLRNRGIGANLLDFVIEMGKQKELEQIWLEVRESNKNAIKLYKSKNFNQTGTRKNYYKKHLEPTPIKEAQQQTSAQTKEQVKEQEQEQDQAKQQTPKPQEYENALLFSLTL